MSSQAIAHVFMTGLVTLFLIILVLVIKAVVKGINKSREIIQFRSNELAKVDLVIQKLDHISVIPSTGKAEYIHFYLNQADEKSFYDISAEYLKRLISRLEKLVNQLDQNNITYGYQYAERKFYIGSKLMFIWKKEVKI